MVARRVQKDGASYFGPFYPATAMRETLRLVRQLFPLRTCRIKIDGTDIRAGTLASLREQVALVTQEVITVIGVAAVFFVVLGFCAARSRRPLVRVVAPGRVADDRCVAVDPRHPPQRPRRRRAWRFCTCLTES